MYFDVPYRGESISEIAEALNCSENTVKSRLNYGRKNLKAKAEELQKKGYKLYSIAPTPLLVYLLMSEKQSMAAEGALEFANDIIAKNVAQAVNASSSAGMSAGAGNAAKAGIGTATKAAKSGFIHTVAGKITAAAIGICITGGAVAVGVSLWNSGEETAEVVNEQEEDDVSTEEVVEEVERQEREEQQENVEPQEEISQDEEDTLSFEDLKYFSFSFSSGAGAWGTGMDIYADGSFSGGYHDSNMGETGEDHPYGTINISNFSGQFAQPVKVNEYTYSMRIRELSYDEEVGKEEIEDGVLYHYERKLMAWRG